MASYTPLPWPLYDWIRTVWCCSCLPCDHCSNCPWVVEEVLAKRLRSTHCREFPYLKLCRPAYSPRLLPACATIYELTSNISTMIMFFFHFEVAGTLEVGEAIMVPTLEGNSEIGAHTWRVISVIWSVKGICLDRESTEKSNKKLLSYTCAPCSELPSDIRTMGSNLENKFSA